MKLARIKNLLTIAGFGLLSQTFNGCTSSPEPEKVPVQKVQTPKVNKPVTGLEYRTDTLYHGTSTLMYYQKKDGIIRNFLENNESFRLQMTYAVHEWWHSCNAKTGYRSRLKFTPYEYFRLCMHDEISANMAALLTVRYEYLSAKDKKAVLKKYQKSQYEFYIDAVKNGKIKPESTDSLDRENEWRLIANGTRDMWMEKFSRHYASCYNYRMVSNYIKCVGLFEASRNNYNIVRRKMYNIGGVDFLSYMDKDIEPVNNLVTIKENILKVRAFRKGRKEMLDFVESNYDVLKNIDVSHQDEAFQHVFISARLKYMLKGVSKENLATHPQIVTSCYEHIITALKSDKSFEDFLKKSNSIDGSRCMVIRNSGKKEYLENIRRMYTFSGVDLTGQIKDFDVKNVPYSDKLESWNTISGNLLHPFTDIQEENRMLEVRTLKELPKEEHAQKLSSVSVPKRRISGKQQLDIPNFNEPILVAASAEQTEEIYDMMRAFDAMPAVLKSCNVKAINEYKKMQEQKNGR